VIQNRSKIPVFANIHETAVISPDAKIGKNVEIAPYTVIGKNVVIADGTKIGAHAMIDGWTTIGQNCVIHSYASIGAEPQDKKFKGEKSYVRIGDNTQIREFVTINRATGEEQETRVGSNCLLLAYSHIAHNCIVGNHVVMSNSASIAGHVEVEDRVTIGGLTGVHQFVRIGRNAMVGACSKVVQDVPPFVTIDGNPAYTCGLNNVGMIRTGIDPETRRALKRAYKLLYFSGLRCSQAIEAIEQQIPLYAEVEMFTRFLRNSERGICRVLSRQK
jgi:UDP-N-acetylglucosamine acyltransferase